MSILSDKEIRELCVPPPFMLKYVQVVANSGSLLYQTREVEIPSYATEEELKEFVNKQGNVAGRTTAAASYRETTPEEITAFKPMIAPYIGEQVRKQHRPLTKEELRAVNSNHPELMKHPEYAVEFPNGPLPMPKGFKVDLQRYWIEGEYEKLISYGQSSYGYDIRIADEFKIFTNINTTVVNPKDFDNRTYVDFRGPVCIIPPNSFVLARSLEYFKMPEDMTGIVFNKSTYARCGIACFTTVIEAGWEGELVLEFSNTSSLPAMLFANEGAAQIVFLKGDQDCEVSYLTRNGKYQGQRGITLPKA